MRKVILLFILILTTSSLIIIKPTDSQITKPSVPEFTLKYVDNSYDVTPTYGIDPYTGKNVMIQAGYHIENKSIEVIIKNQPFTPYRNENNSLVELYYYILAKGHFQDWSSGMPNPGSRVGRSDGEYTVITYGIGVNNGSDIYHRQLEEVSVGGHVDFKVQALTGYSTRISRGLYSSQFGEAYYYVFSVVETSGWSSIQTISIPNGAVSISPSQNPATSPTTSDSQNSTVTPQQPNTQSGVLFGLNWEQVAIILLGVTVVALAVALVLLRKSGSKQTPKAV